MIPEEGDVCPNCGDGVVIIKEPEDCSCHVNAPCSYCVTAPLFCPLCETEWDSEEE